MPLRLPRPLLYPFSVVCQRLKTPNFKSSDIDLFSHEYFESRFEKIFKAEENTDTVIYKYCSNLVDGEGFTVDKTNLEKIKNEKLA